MPRTVPESKRNAWYADYRSGKSIHAIAKAHNADPRTVRRAIDELHERAAHAEAAASVRKAALLEHQRTLLEFLGGIAAVLKPVSPSLNLPTPMRELPDVLQFEGGYIDRTKPIPTLRLDAESQLWWRLLHEHLGVSDVFRDIRSWKRAAGDEAEARLKLREHLLHGLQDQLGIQIEEGAEVKGSITALAVYNVEEAVVSTLLEEKPAKLTVWVDKDGRFYLDKILAGRAAVVSSELADRIQQMPEALAKQQPATDYYKAYRTTQRAADKARNTIEVLRAGFYIPGTCQACRT